MRIFEVKFMQTTFLAASGFNLTPELTKDVANAENKGKQAENKGKQRAAPKFPPINF